MFGWKARLGVIIPSPNTTLESEAPTLVPDGVSVHVARLDFDDSGDQARKQEVLLAMRLLIDNAIAQVIAVAPDAVAFACTSASYAWGSEVDRQLCSEATQTTGVQVTTSARALVNACQALGLQRIVSVSPYDAGVESQQVAYFRDNGITIDALGGHVTVSSLDKGRESPHSIYQLARQMDFSNVDGLVISCTNWPSASIIADLEANIGKPVITSNQATLWQLLQIAGVNEAIAGCGSLLGPQLGRVLDERITV